MPDFEPRAGQVEMAAAVARVFETGGVLLAEAGTGTGKTLAYLIPAILRRERVLISTGTKNLQEQIFFKDIPALRDALGVPFTATYMKGRANYLCLHKLDQLNDGDPQRAFGNDVFLPVIREWSARTDTGDRAELEDLPEDLPFWNEVAATADTCLGTECTRYDDCYVTKMRQRAAAADVVIVNHHLLCADAAVRQNAYGEVIPACHRAILDEAHQLEDIATQYFGCSVSNYRVEELARDIERSLLAIVGDDRKAKDDVARAIETLRDCARAFFNDLAFAHRGGRSEWGRGSSTASEWGRGPTSIRNEDRLRVTVDSLAQAADTASHLSGALDVIQSTLALLVRLRPDAAEPASGGEADDDLDPESRDETIATLLRRTTELRDDLRFLMRCGD